MSKLISQAQAVKPAQALLMAAGRGERMRPLTDSTPKPLLVLRGRPLMEWSLRSLAAAGFDNVVVNTAWLGNQIEERFGTSDNRLCNRTAVTLRYSHEGRDFGGALETAGGIARALPLLDDVFWVAAGDIYAPGFRFSQEAFDRFASSGRLAHLWLVPNPEHNPSGDFGISPDGLALSESTTRFTFSAFGLYRAALFAEPFCDIPFGNPRGVKAKLAPILRAAMAHGKVSAELYTGEWHDIGTPQRLAALDGS